ncbi:hypothetical protein F5I97DRAFT_1827839 [Phlebopus sp. FC_14]|nr:hypothetical protein F5I97DRAFT_1827839 [Phlebopus sp. FC_14]
MATPPLQRVQPTEHVGVDVVHPRRPYGSNRFAPVLTIRILLNVHVHVPSSCVLIADAGESEETHRKAYLKNTSRLLSLIHFPRQTQNFALPFLEALRSDKARQTTGKTRDKYNMHRGPFKYQCATHLVTLFLKLDDGHAGYLLLSGAASSVKFPLVSSSARPVPPTAAAASATILCPPPSTPAATPYADRDATVTTLVVESLRANFGRVTPRALDVPLHHRSPLLTDGDPPLCTPADNAGATPPSLLCPLVLQTQPHDERGRRVIPRIPTVRISPSPLMSPPTGTAFASRLQWTQTERSSVGVVHQLKPLFGCRIRQSWKTTSTLPSMIHLSRPNTHGTQTLSASAFSTSVVVGFTRCRCLFNNAKSQEESVTGAVGLTLASATTPSANSKRSYIMVDALKKSARARVSSKVKPDPTLQHEDSRAVIGQRATSTMGQRVVAFVGGSCARDWTAFLKKERTTGLDALLPLKLSTRS